MSAPRVVVLDYGSGNVRSACRALERAGADVELTADRERARSADGLVVPGVGAFAAVMEQLRGVDGVSLIRERVDAGRAVLGICVGFQVLFESSTEKDRHAGIGLWPGEVHLLDAPVVPHMGWSTVQAAPGSALFAGVGDQRFYFVHSYAVTADPARGTRGGRLVTWARHGQRFVAAVEDGPLAATQFHPEKSGQAGARLLGNWLARLA